MFAIFERAAPHIFNNNRLLYSSMEMTVKASEKTTGLLGKIKNHPIITMVASAATGIVMIAAYIGAYDTITDKINELFGGGQTATIAAINDSVTIKEDQVVQIDVLENDINIPDPNTLSINLDGTGTRGQVRKLGENIIEYLPENNDSGSDAFSYTIITPEGEKASARVDVTIEEVNDPPVAPMDAIIASYPQESVLIVDILGNAFDPDGEQMRLVSYGSPGHKAQPKSIVKLLDPWKAAMSINGINVNIDSKNIESLKGHLLLPIGSWVNEEVKDGNRNSFVQVVNYRVEDDRGLGQDFSFNVEVRYPLVLSLGLECERDGDGGPDKVEIELMLDGDSVTKYKYRLAKMDYFGLSGFSRELTAIDFHDDIEMQATWKSVESKASFDCKTSLYVKDFGLIDHGEVELKFAPRHYKDKWKVLVKEARFWNETQTNEVIGRLIGMSNN